MNQSGGSSLVVQGAVLGFLLLGMSCNSLGPAAIFNGREAYNEAIRTTGEQQILKLIVELRYGRLAGLLSVVSVTANMRFGASTVANFGFGRNENFAGNLVPLSFGFAYEENPTISYVPLEGEAYIRQLMGPLPLDLYVLLVSSAMRSEWAFLALTQRINGIENSGIRNQSGEDPRFVRIAELIARLRNEGRLVWVQESEAEADQFSLLLRPRDDEGDEVRELIDLLGLPKPDLGAGAVFLPIVLAAEPRTSNEVTIATRSLWDLVHILASTVEVPEEDLASGKAIDYEVYTMIGESVCIHRSESYPDEAAVVVPYRDAWYYIDDKDMDSKSLFQLTKILLQVRIADTAKSNQSRPVLTLPVSR